MGKKKRAKAAKFPTLDPLLTFDTLMICFREKTITYGGRVIRVDSDCVDLPITNDKTVLIRAIRSGWEPIHP